jgi:hypothetical protein
VLPFITKRVIKLKMHDVAQLVRDCVKPNLKTSKKDGTFFTDMSADSQAKLAALGSGCTVVTLDDEDAAKYKETLGEGFAAVSWHGASSIHFLVTHEELEVLYMQMCESGLGCGVDEEYEAMKLAKDEKAATETETPAEVTEAESK